MAPTGWQFAASGGKVNQMAHLLADAFWLGGLLPLGWFLAKRRAPDAAWLALGREATEMLNVIPAEHHRMLIAALEAIERGDNDRLMILMPPGSGKSIDASVAFPPWYLGRNSVKAIITASYGQRLSMRFGRKCRNIGARPRYGEIFGCGLAADSSAKDEWETSTGGEFTATSVDGAVTGRRGDLILVDDPVKGRAITRPMRCSPVRIDRAKRQRSHSFSGGQTSS